MTAFHDMPHMCGCSACCAHLHGQERDAATIDRMLADPTWRQANVEKADEWADGMQSGEHYTALEIAMADLSEVPAERLIGSDALATVLRLAAVHGEARKKYLREMAEAEIERSEAE